MHDTNRLVKEDRMLLIVTSGFPLMHNQAACCYVRKPEFHHNSTAE